MLLLEGLEGFTWSLGLLNLISDDCVACEYGLVLLLDEIDRLYLSTCPGGINRVAHSLKEPFRLIDPLSWA